MVRGMKCSTPNTDVSQTPPGLMGPTTVKLGKREAHSLSAGSGPQTPVS